MKKAQQTAHRRFQPSNWGGRPLGRRNRCCAYCVSSLLLLLSIPLNASAGEWGDLKQQLVTRVYAENLLRQPQPPSYPGRAAASVISGDWMGRPRLQRSAPRSIALGMRFLLLAPIRIHQKFITHQDGDVCTLRPSCSHYGAEAVRRHGLRGLLMAGDRILRCHGGNHERYPDINGFGYDPVPPRKKKKVTRDE